jgi:hypothetical protein
MNNVKHTPSHSKTMVNAQSKFPALFQGLGLLKTAHSIVLKPNAIPFAIHVPRHVPIPLLEKLCAKLDKMEQQQVIVPVHEATSWCLPLVLTTKANGDICTCIDLTQLNKAVQCELHPMPVVEHTLVQVASAQYFSKLDALSGFWQIPLSPESSLLTTFITPFGRYCFLCLPFGISSAPEHFQCQMSTILHNLPGILCHMDDVLIFGSTIKEHDMRLRATLRTLLHSGLMLNEDKCEFGKTTIQFLGHIIDQQGIRADPAKIEAIKDLPPPTNVTSTHQFLGMVNHLGQFIPHLSTISQPLNELLQKNSLFVWGPTQQQAFDKLKGILSCNNVLKPYSVSHPTYLSADASSYGLGAVLKQLQPNGQMHPIAYASRTLNLAECNYAQIEKDALAITWACDRFQDLILGARINVVTDHKPLLPILTTKPLDTLTPQLQCL